MSVLSPSAKLQFTDITGAPLVGGFLYTYAAGTTTPLATYTDSSGTSLNSNPVVLNARGEASVWLGANTYKFKLTDSSNNEIWTVDNISAPTTALSPVLSGNVIINSDSSDTALTITQTGTGAVMRVQDSVDPDSTPFIINTSGNIGIGTATPTAKVDLADGDFQFSTVGGTIYTNLSADATDSIVAVSNDRNFTVKTNGVTRVTINSSAATFAVPIVGSWANIPAGTAMLFVQTTAPTGWTKSTTHNNKALRIVSGTASSGGSTAFTSVFTARTITTDNMPTHTHGVTDPGHFHAVDVVIGINGGGGGAIPYPAGGGTNIITSSVSTGISIQSAGSGTAMDFNVAYVDAIIAVKN